MLLFISKFCAKPLERQFITAELTPRVRLAHTQFARTNLQSRIDTALRNLSMVTRTKTPLMEFYRRKKREKGSGKAICATARKLLTIIFVMLKKELDYWYSEDRLYNRKLRALNAVA